MHYTDNSHYVGLYSFRIRQTAGCGCWRLGEGPSPSPLDSAQHERQHGVVVRSHAASAGFGSCGS